MKIVFMGTPEFSVKALEAIISQYDVVGVVTQPDKVVGRNQEIKYSSVKETAVKHNVKVLQPNKIRTEYKDILELNPDIIVTCAYGQIIPKEILDYPKYGCINIHASLLPKYRGGAPIHRAIYNGDSETGITIMYMDEKMDTGNIISQSHVPIEYEDNLEIIHNKLSKLGSEMIIKVLEQLENEGLTSYKQDESKVTYAYNIKREEEIIDWNRTSKEIYDHIRAFNPYPGTYFNIGNTVIKVWETEEDKNYSSIPGEIVKSSIEEVVIQTGEGSISLKLIQPFGKKRMTIKEYMNGKGKEVLKLGEKK